MGLLFNIIELFSEVISPLKIWNNSLWPFPEIPAMPRHSPRFTEKFIFSRFVSNGSSLLKLRFDILINSSIDSFSDIFF